MKIFPFVLMAVVGFIASCGGSGNLFEPLQNKSGKDNAKAALENGNYAAAATALESYCAKNPNDQQAKSMLATAYMKESGVDEIAIASKITAAQQSPGNSNFGSIVQALPAGTPQNVAKLQEAVQVLSQIPPAQRTQDQSYQLAIAQASFAVTLTKQVTGSDGSDGKIKNIQAITPNDADEIYNSLQGTQQALSAAGVDQSQGAGKLGSVVNQVNSQQGATNGDKLINFLNSNNH